VLVVGAGPVGVLASQVARQSGAARVFVVEPLEHRRATALRSGADGVWAPEHAVDAALEATAGRGVDVVIEMAGADAAIDIAVEAIRPGGRVVLGGIPSDDRSSFPAGTARRKGLTFTMVRRMNATYPRAIELASSAIDLDLLVSDHYPLAEAPKAFATAAERHGDKVVIRVSTS
jgi:L-iditol 2-dehydrogenase